MADTKISEMTADTAPAITDLLVHVADPSTTPVTKKITISDVLKAINGLTEDTAPDTLADFVLTYDTSASAAKKVKPVYLGALGTDNDGSMYNGKLSVTVASNNITVALKTLAGSDPTSSDFVSIRINGVNRFVTAALSVTKNAGTNWCNSGGSELATKEIDYFVYLGYNATDGVVIGFSRIPYARQYSDFSTTTTAETYAAISTITTAASTDYYFVIGRFAATLSGGAGYTWTVPTYTAINLINRPIYETRWISWTPAWTAGGSLTFTSVTTAVSKYKLEGKKASIQISGTGTLGGSAATSLLATVPIEATESANSMTVGSGFTASVFGGMYITAGTPDKLTIIKYDNSNYATSGSCTVIMNGFYETG